MGCEQANAAIIVSAQNLSLRGMLGDEGLDDGQELLLFFAWQ